MLRIYDDRELHQRLRLRQFTALMLFATGLIVGRHWAGGDDGLALAQSSKTPSATLGLKLDERLHPSQPPASNRALPPTAEVLTVSVRSETNLRR